MADWYVWASVKPDGSPPTNWQSGVRRRLAWTWSRGALQPTMHNSSGQPQLNVHNRAVQDRCWTMSSRF